MGAWETLSGAFEGHDPGIDQTGIAQILHRELRRSFSVNVDAISKYWLAFDYDQRSQCCHGYLREHMLENTQGDLHYLIPELNKNRVCGDRIEFLHTLRYRAIRGLHEQYKGARDLVGDGEFPGDLEFVRSEAARYDLRPICHPKDNFMFFLNDFQYGRGIEVYAGDTPSFKSWVTTAMRHDDCVPASVGDLVLRRQIYTFYALIKIVRNILDLGSKLEAKKNPPSKANTDVPTSTPKSKKLKTGVGVTTSKSGDQVTFRTPALLDFISHTVNILVTHEDFLRSLSEEPIVLTHFADLSFLTRPELLPDEQGRILAHDEQLMSAAVLETFYTSVKTLAIWTYLVGLFTILASDPPPSKAFKATLLQEISNVFYMEFGRARLLFGRYVSTGIGPKCFKRVSNVLDKAGNTKVVMKGKPDVLAQGNTALHLMLRLCHPDTGPALVKEAFLEFNALDEEQRSKLEESEVDALHLLWFISCFIERLSILVPLPSMSRKKNQLFVSRCQALDAEINNVESKIDLSVYVNPVDNILGPGIQKKLLKTVEKFIANHTGTKVGFLFQDLIEDSFADLKRQKDAANCHTEVSSAAAALTQMSLSGSTLLENRMEQRKQKDTNRMRRLPVFKILPASSLSVAADESNLIIRVKPAMVNVFTTIFTKADSVGTVDWTTFEEAMLDLGFCAKINVETIYSFTPPGSTQLKHRVTLLRPYSNDIHGYRLIIIKNRLRRAYGWNEKTFEAKE